MTGATTATEIDREFAKQRFALIGAGALAEMTLEMWPGAVPRPDFVLDSNKTGELLGTPIKPLPGHAPDPDVCYLLAIFQTKPATIKSIMAGLGTVPLVTVYDLLDRYLHDEFSNGWSHLSPDAKTQGLIDVARGAFQDPNARRVFEAATNWRYNRILVDDYPTVAGPERFLINNLGRQGQAYDLVIDGGAYDLSLHKALKASDVRFDNYIGFEPDPDNAEIAKSKAKEIGGAITVETKALAATSGQSSFLANGLMSARLTDVGKAEADTVCLDDYVSGLPVGPKRMLCKLHVESAEPDVLAGAMQITEDLAIDWFVNLSHDERSLLEVPVWFQQWGRYELFLRSYSLFGEGLTLFARDQRLLSA